MQVKCGMLPITKKLSHSFICKIPSLDPPLMPCISHHKRLFHLSVAHTKALVRHSERFQSRTMAVMAARKQPPWQLPTAPTNATLPPLKIWNSLTRSKTAFYPIDPAGRVVTWYACGPTVYDDAHLGHARNFVTTDIIRRILRDFFKFKVNFVMNITDIDDKVSLARATCTIFPSLKLMTL